MTITQEIVKKSSALKQSYLVKIDNLEAFTSILKVTDSLDALCFLSFHVNALSFPCTPMNFSNVIVCIKILEFK
jgi:hypothetical protein